MPIASEAWEDFLADEAHFDLQASGAQPRTLSIT